MLGFAWVWVWILLVLPFLVRRNTPSDAHENDGALKVPFFDEIAKLNNRSTIVSGSGSKDLRLLVLFVIWALLVCAAARPQWAGPAMPVLERARNMVLVVDISNSMAEEDFEKNRAMVNRLVVVKDVARDFLLKRKGDRVGVVAFGQKTYQYVPLTSDVKSAADMVAELEIGFAGPLTAIGDALAMATKAMKDVPADEKVVVLLSDGEANAGAVNVDQALEAAKNEGVKIYTVGVGAYEKTVSTFFGPQKVNPSTALDENTLKRMAKETGGAYFRAYDTKELEKIYAEIDKLEPADAGTAFVKPVKELFFVPLGVAIILSVLAGVFFMQGVQRLWRR